MPNQSRLRVNACRLVEGRATNQDVDELLLGVREVCRNNGLKGFESACDMADFVAHQIGRDRGACLDFTILMHQYLRFRRKQFGHSNYGKGELQNWFRAFSKVRERSFFGKERKKFQILSKKSLKNLCDKVLSLTNGKIFFKSDLSKRERELYHEIVEKWVSPSIYDSNELMSEIAKILIFDKAIEEENYVLDSLKFSNAIILNLVCKLHLMNIVDNDNNCTYALSAGISENNIIVIYCKYDVSDSVSELHFSTIFFDTNLSGDEWASNGLIELGHFESHHLELNSDGKIDIKL